MPPERSRQLVYELDAWYRAHTMRQKDLASTLGLSPQGLNEILALRNRPTGEQALAILEFLRTNNMVNHPNTLSKALDQIDVLTAELQELKKASKATTLPTANIQIPAATPRPPIAPQPAATQPKEPESPGSAWEAELARVDQARKVGLSDKPLSEQSLPELRAALANEPNSEKRGQIYKMVKAAERKLLGPERVARLHGA